MKKIILSLLLISFLAVPLIGLAVPVIDPDAPIPPAVGPMEAIANITRAVFNILMGVAILFVLYGAFTILMAAGDAEKMGKGKTMIIYALIAVIVAVLAQGIIAWIPVVLR